MKTLQKNRKLNKNTRLSKEAIYWKVLNAAVALDLRFGHQRWTLSQLSRSSGVSRPLIYYYFGKSKLAILEIAVRVIGEKIGSTTQEEMLFWKKNLAESVMQTRKILSEHRAIFPFYATHRELNSPLSELLKSFEKLHIQRLQEGFPHLSESVAKCISAILWGLTFVPYLTGQEVEFACDTLLGLMSRGPGLQKNHLIFQ